MVLRDFQGANAILCDASQTPCDGADAQSSVVHGPWVVPTHLPSHHSLALFRRACAAVTRVHRAAALPVQRRSRRIAARDGAATLSSAPAAHAANARSVLLYGRLSRPGEAPAAFFARCSAAAPAFRLNIMLFKGGPKTDAWCDSRRTGYADARCLGHNSAMRASALRLTRSWRSGGSTRCCTSFSSTLPGTSRFTLPRWAWVARSSWMRLFRLLP